MGNTFSENSWLMGMEAATPAGTARAGATGLSAAREAAEAVPSERVRRTGHQPGLLGQPLFMLLPTLRYKSERLSINPHVTSSECGHAELPIHAKPVYG